MIMRNLSKLSQLSKDYIVPASNIGTLDHRDHNEASIKSYFRDSEGERKNSDTIRKLVPIETTSTIHTAAIFIC